MTNQILNPCPACKNDSVCRKAKTCQRFADYIDSLEAHYEQSKGAIPKKNVIINVSPADQAIEIPQKLVPEFACALAAKLMEYVKCNVSADQGQHLATETVDLITSLFL